MKYNEISIFISMKNSWTQLVLHFVHKYRKLRWDFVNYYFSVILVSIFPQTTLEVHI